MPQNIAALIGVLYYMEDPTTLRKTYRLLSDLFACKKDVPLTSSEVFVCLDWLKTVLVPGHGPVGGPLGPRFAPPAPPRALHVQWPPSMDDTEASQVPDMTPIKKQIREIIAQNSLESPVLMADAEQHSSSHPNASDAAPECQSFKKAPVILTRTAKTILDVLDNNKLEPSQPIHVAMEEDHKDHSHLHMRHHRTPEKDLPIVELPEPTGADPHHHVGAFDLNLPRRSSLSSDLPRFHFSLDLDTAVEEAGAEAEADHSDPSLSSKLPHFEFNIE